MIIEGAISVKAALASRWRKVERIYIEENKRSGDVSFIVKKAYDDRITVERCSKDKIMSLASGKTHGGILAEVSERKFQSVTGLLANDKPLLALVEGIEDGYNLGYVLRSLYAFGFDGVILPQREWDFEDSTIIKSSAGASEFIAIHMSSDLNETLGILHENGIRIVSAYRGEGAHNLYKADLSGSGILLCIGGPLRGLSREVLENSDEFIYIPYANNFRNALNAASAAVVIAGEAFRQRNMEESE